MILEVRKCPHIWASHFSLPQAARSMTHWAIITGRGTRPIQNQQLILYRRDKKVPTRGFCLSTFVWHRVVEYQLPYSVWSLCIYLAKMGSPIYEKHRVVPPIQSDQESRYQFEKCFWICAVLQCLQSTSFLLMADKQIQFVLGYIMPHPVTTLSLYHNVA